MLAWHVLLIYVAISDIIDENEEIELDSEQWELKISTIQNLVPTAANVDRIFSLMSETFGVRRKWILGQHSKEGGPTIAAILAKYPRFIDLPGLVRFFVFAFTFSFDKWRPCLCFDQCAL